MTAVQLLLFASFCEKEKRSQSSNQLKKKKEHQHTLKQRMSSSQENSKLIATAVGAAAAGAALAVAALKMMDSDKRDGGPWDPYDPAQRRHRQSILMNDPESAAPGLERRESESLLFPHNHEEKMRRRIATRFTIEEENNTPRQSVTVRVPATSANVGPGCKFLTHNIEKDGNNRTFSHFVSCLFISFLLEYFCR